MFNINSQQPKYDPTAVQPMRDELTYIGFTELKTEDEVHKYLSNKNDETTFVFINSVCGCAAGSARPGISLALQCKTIPNNIVTAFAGQDNEAVNAIRTKYLRQFAPSSPSAALIKNGEVIFMMPRHYFEGRREQHIAELLNEVFVNNCSKEGPSIPKEKFELLVHARKCGSKIPLNN